MSSNFSKNNILIISISVVTALIISITANYFLNKRYILNNGEIIIKAVTNYQKKIKSEQTRSSEKNLATSKNELYQSSSPYIGSNNAKIILVEFFDYNCGYCKKAYAAVSQLYSNNKDIKIIFKDYPIFPGSSKAKAKGSVAISILSPKKYFLAHQKLIQTANINNENDVSSLLAKTTGLDKILIKEKMNSTEVRRIIEQNSKLARRLGFSGTPAFIINGKVVNGYIPYPALQKMVDKL